MGVDIEHQYHIRRKVTNKNLHHESSVAYLIKVSKEQEMKNLRNNDCELYLWRKIFNDYQIFFVEVKMVKWNVYLSIFLSMYVSSKAEI